ncbi:MAG TPA: hypothetical protein VHE60_08010 [Pyrinomonadaceae bacterium]|nr:hypothetical protein [Pyrinomonadaceae bacterium]
MTSDPAYNHQTITQYLLGALPAAETERLDELGFTDDEFADSLKAAEKDLVDAYVQSELTDAALEQFESHYLASPLRREKVAFAQAFQVFGERESASLRAKGSTNVAAKRGWFAALSTFLAPRPAYQWGLAAAALALLVVGSWLAVDNLRLRQQMSQTAARRDVLIQREQDLQKELEGQRVTNSQAEQELARVRDERERLEQELKKEQQGGTKRSSGEASIVSLILAPPLRGAGQAPTLSIRPGTNRVAAQLQLEATDYSTYRVALIDPVGNRTLWHSGNIKPGIYGDRRAVGVAFSAGLLKPQNYILRVAGSTAGGGSEIVGDYPFKVVK